MYLMLKAVPLGGCVCECVVSYCVHMCVGGYASVYVSVSECEGECVQTRCVLCYRLFL